MDGASIIAESLAKQGVKFIFGVVGIPIIEVAIAAQQHDIKFIAMRNEQSATYAAQAIGYITGRPAVCLVVSGPGLLHAIGGMANATVNGWPLIVMAGSSDREQEGTGAFQEWPQVESARLHCKHVARVSSLERIPFYVEQAVRTSVSGRPGAVYIDVPGDFVNATVEESAIVSANLPREPPRCQPPMECMRKAITLLAGAVRPLVIVGKGAASSPQSDGYIRAFVEKWSLPFLPTPMGKGVLPDDHELCVAPARSDALKNADVVLLLGARLNWMLHFGQPPRLGQGVKIVQIDLCPEQFHQNLPTACALLGDIGITVRQLLQLSNETVPNRPKWTDWLAQLTAKCEKNKATVEKMACETTLPLNYYAAYKPIRELLPRNAYIINEGANTMDIGRTMLPNFLPRHRLDAGTFGTMGVGLGFAIAAALHVQEAGTGEPVFCVQGDSAFGFGGMELETVARYKLRIILIVINNNGIYSGVDEESWNENFAQDPMSSPPTSLLPSARYDLMAKAFGLRGALCKNVNEIQREVQAALQANTTTLINILISPTAARKPQQFEWLTRSKM